MFEILCQTEYGTDGNKLLVDIVLPPADSVAVITLEEMVIIVVTLTVSNNGQEPVIPCGIFITIWAAAPHMA